MGRIAKLVILVFVVGVCGLTWSCDDVVVPEGSFAMARAIRACGGRKSRLTIYPDLGHNAWDPAYADPALYLWLLSHRRGIEE